MRKVALLFLLLLTIGTHAQHDLYVGGQLDAGILSNPSFGNGPLDQKFFSPQLGGLLTAKLRMFDAIAIEVGIGQHWNNSRLKDPAFESANDGFSVKLNNSNYYWSYYTAISGMIRINSSRTYLYGKLSYSQNVYGKQTLNESKTFQIARSNIDQTLNYTNSYQQSNLSIQPEIGIQYKTPDRNLISAGIKLNLGQSNASNGSYVIVDNVSGTETNSQLSSLGNFTAFTFRYDILIRHISKKERAKKLTRKEIKDMAIDLNKPKPDPKIDTAIDTIATDTTIAVQPKIDSVVVSPPNMDLDTNRTDTSYTTPKEIDGRVINVSKKVKVHSSKVTVSIWDHQTVDGDRVSLNFNGKWILTNYTLKKEKYQFNLHLVDGKNVFVLHALNLGKYIPNTAALIVEEEDGKKHRIILESDLNESGTLEINYKKRRKEK